MSTGEVAIEVQDESSLMLAVLDWVLDEHLAGRRPNDVDVAKHFGLSVEQAVLLHDKLEAAGEFE